MVNPQATAPRPLLLGHPEGRIERGRRLATGQEWEDEIQPARFNGWNAAGEMLWNFIGFDGSSDWPVLWVGEAIEVPIVPARCPVLQM